MTLTGIRIAGVGVLVLGVMGMAGRAVMAQAQTAQGSPKVAAQIIQPDQEDEFAKGAVTIKASLV